MAIMSDAHTDATRADFSVSHAEAILDQRKAIAPPPCVPRLVMVKAPHFRQAWPALIINVREDDAIDATIFCGEPNEKPTIRATDIPHLERATGGGWYWEWPSRS